MVNKLGGDVAHKLTLCHRLPIACMQSRLATVVGAMHGMMRALRRKVLATWCGWDVAQWRPEGREWATCPELVNLGLDGVAVKVKLDSSQEELRRQQQQ